jgi:hypothetical protein
MPLGSPRVPERATRDNSNDTIGSSASVRGELVKRFELSIAAKVGPSLRAALMAVTKWYSSAIINSTNV